MVLVYEQQLWELRGEESAWLDVWVVKSLGALWDGVGVREVEGGSCVEMGPNCQGSEGYELGPS
jgi:hypothetical protein